VGRGRRCSNLALNDTLFDEGDLRRCFDKVQAVDFHQTVELDGIRFFCHHAGHVLGACMFNIEIAGVKVVWPPRAGAGAYTLTGPRAGAWRAGVLHWRLLARRGPAPAGG
jgi:hypothetical protein